MKRRLNRYTSSELAIILDALYHYAKRDDPMYRQYVRGALEKTKLRYRKEVERAK